VVVGRALVLHRRDQHAAEAVVPGPVGLGDGGVDTSYRERPVLVNGDGPIAEYRRWYAQFYEGNDLD
jgi:hypothetical protein